jgi:hypothetical protein
VLLCITHPNNLIDLLLVASVLPRKVYYLATAALSTTCSSRGSSSPWRDSHLPGADSAREAASGWGMADDHGLPALRVRGGCELPPYYLPAWLARRLARRQTDYATIRLLASVVAFLSRAFEMKRSDWTLVHYSGGTELH